ncbi:Alpha-amylase, partial [Dissostichus eleginoides]
SSLGSRSESRSLNRCQVNHIIGAADMLPPHMTPISSQLMHYKLDTVGDIVRRSGFKEGGGVAGGLGQAEFTYLSAGSLPDFTEHI